ncbi:ribonuclease P protein component [Leptolyngbya sp. NK1-12]|uniref:Ribonuclease P protein component n=1 Tax=Leptolyngbya sp. NK1-12 TaxID=2547451 RepID=A0AA96WJM8_9CYAN|nr:ribonuclease P protein component [Leptolyngbya sp. NK1-12]WNZ25880.1 ribonuclease P protein component [Leptolyngbya sp. NK1-12]
MALPKAHRLRHRQDFSAVYQAGSRQSGPHLTLRALRKRRSVRLERLELSARSDLDQFDQSDRNGKEQTQRQEQQAIPPTQIGISISQKVSKRAVVRNRIKRQLRAIVQQFLPQISPGWQLVIVVKPNAAECGYEQFLQELKQLLISAEVINGH